MIAAPTRQSETSHRIKMIRRPTTVLAIILDLVLLVSGLATFSVLLGMGGQLTVGPVSISITSARHSLSIALVACVLRSAMPNVKFLGLVSLARLPGAAHDWWKRRSALGTITDSQASRIVLFVLAASAAIKLLIAYTQPGFWTGDDVEIHEMTFAKLFGWRWRAWELRSPFYPLGVIYPIQALASSMGATDPGTLVFAGRAVVAGVSLATLWLTFRLGRRLFSSVPIGLCSVLILATNKLHTIGGSSELPRTVSSFFVLSAYGLLTVAPTTLHAFWAGASVGVASAMRFSEQLFAVPAIVQIAVRRDWRQITAFICGFMVVAAIVFGGIDALYWGEPFFSLKHIVDFTLVQRLSTRGYEPFYEYVIRILDWTNPVVAGLALAAMRRRNWVLALWTWLPIILLSLLPHKEPRYLIPVLPFFAMMAASSLWAVIQWLKEPVAIAVVDRGKAGLVLFTACVAALISEVGGFVVPRSNGGVAVARYIARTSPADGVVVVQSWTIGGRLYLPSATLLDLTPEEVANPAIVSGAIRSSTVRWVILHDRDVRRFQYDSLLHASGFNEIFLQNSDNYRLFCRQAHPP